MSSSCTRRVPSLTRRDVFRSVVFVVDQDPNALDLRQGSIKRVASAVGDGETVVRLVHEHLRDV